MEWVASGVCGVATELLLLHTPTLLPPGKAGLAIERVACDSIGHTTPILFFLLPTGLPLVLLFFAIVDHGCLGRSRRATKRLVVAAPRPLVDTPTVHLIQLPLAIEGVAC